MDSSILTSAYDKYSLLSLIGQESNSFSLLWRGTRDGFGAEDFHRLCDYKGKTLTVIKNTEGWIFGGYTSVPWSSEGGDFIGDNNVLLFTLTNPSGTPFKWETPTLDGVNTLEHCSHIGPSFIWRLCVHDKSNENKKSYMEMKLPNCKRGAEGGQSIVGGKDDNFQTIEIEVFKVS